MTGRHKYVGIMAHTSLDRRDVILILLWVDVVMEN